MAKGLLSGRKLPKDPELPTRAAAYSSDLPAKLSHEFKGPIKISSSFSHQVAGHFPIYKAQGGLLCKPLVPRELWFYNVVEACLPELLEFLPTTHGYISSDPKDVYELAQKEIQEADAAQQPWALHQQAKFITDWDASQDENEAETDTQISRIVSSKKDPVFYMVLDDVTQGFAKPCVMDLKIGTRTWGKGIPAAKVASHSRKCFKTTSKELGLRLSGFKTYDTSERGFRHMDKYEGRALNAPEFQQALLAFFHNGERMRTDVLELMVDAAKKLLVLVSMPDFPFHLYSSSLLLAYEGDPGAPLRAELRMIDFAHTHVVGEGEERDDGYHVGLQNLVTYFESCIEGRSDVPLYRSTWAKASESEKQNKLKGRKSKKGAEDTRN